MMKNRSCEMLFIPSNLGLIRIHISGFESLADSGEVVAVLNDFVVTKRGYFKRRMILNAFIKLNKMIAEQ